MAGRNQRRSADYFSHDADASMDEKLIYLESKFGHTGYALYFKFLERMTRSDDFMLEWNDIKKSVYASEFGISVTEIEQFVTECCRKEIKAFKIKNNKIFSFGLLERMKPLIEKREYNRRKYEEQKSKNNSKLHNSVTEKGSVCNRIDTVKERKGKESKVKKRKEYSPNLKKFARDFIDHIKKTEPTKAPSGKDIYNKSMETIDKIIRIDGFEEEYVFKVIRWAKADSFWGCQVYSLAGLRAKGKNGLTKFQNMAVNYDKGKGVEPIKTKEQLLKEYSR